MAQIQVSDRTVKRYQELRKRVQEQLGTSRVTQRVAAMDEDQVHTLVTDLLELFDVTDPLFTQRRTRKFDRNALQG